MCRITMCRMNKCLKKLIGHFFIYLFKVSNDAGLSAGGRSVLAPLTNLRSPSLQYCLSLHIVKTTLKCHFDVVWHIVIRHIVIWHIVIQRFFYCIKMCKMSKFFDTSSFDTFYLTLLTIWHFFRHICFWQISRIPIKRLIKTKKLKFAEKYFKFIFEFKTFLFTLKV